MRRREARLRQEGAAMALSQMLQMTQAEEAARGDDEAMGVDEEFLRALEHGMPPAAGVGMGMDRLLMALTGLGIRETILFPLVK